MPKRSLPKLHPKPRDFALVDGMEYEDVAIFKRLKTLEDVQLYWNAIKASHPYVCRSSISGIDCLEIDEWIFSKTKSGAVAAALRWTDVGIQCHWYDWAGDKSPTLKMDGEDYDSWFRNRDESRQTLIDQGTWSVYDEKRYQSDIAARTPENFKGWWVLKNLPKVSESIAEYFDWDGASTAMCSIVDPSLSIQNVTKQFQCMLFDGWRSMGDCPPVTCYCKEDVKEFLEYWLGCKSRGDEYYGMEEEKALSDETTGACSTAAQTVFGNTPQRLSIPSAAFETRLRRISPGTNNTAAMGADKRRFLNSGRSSGVVTSQSSGFINP
jgi:hypothetical protein